MLATFRSAPYTMCTTTSRIPRGPCYHRVDKWSGSFEFHAKIDILAPDAHSAELICLVRNYRQKRQERAERQHDRDEGGMCPSSSSESESVHNVVSGRGIKPSSRKVEAVRNCTVPKSVSEVRKFLGIVNPFRRFVLNFAERARPLTDLLKGGAKGTPTGGGARSRRAPSKISASASRRRLCSDTATTTSPSSSTRTPPRTSSRAR